MSIDEENSINEEVPEETKKKLNALINKAPKLELTIIASLFLEENLKIKINCKGLEDNSLRNIKDGKTYFGLVSPSNENINKKIDFNTGNNDIINTNSDIHYGLQFRIKFDINNCCYFIKDCSFGNGYGTFMKVYKEMIIKDNTLINIGENYIVFTFGVDEIEPEENDTIDDEKQNILSVKVFRGELVNYSYVFNKSQVNKIIIGKGENCNIVLNDELLDDVHCVIQFKELGWFIKDGDENNNTANGTWISLSEETKIFEGMLIQSNQNIYQCHLIE